MPTRISFKRKLIHLRFPNGILMLDVFYLLGTVLFFALMVGYVGFCERLAGPGDPIAVNTEKRA